MALGVGGWIRCDEKTAREAEHWRRFRKPGALWCPIIGNHLGIAQDAALQAYFLTVPEDGWQHLASGRGLAPDVAVPCWRDAGRRVLRTSSVQMSGALPPPGRLAGWPARPGTGPRSLLSYRYILPDHLSVRMIGDGLFVYTNDRMETITQVPGHFYDGLG